jgi:hypothetical protein
MLHGNECFQHHHHHIILYHSRLTQDLEVSYVKQIYMVPHDTYIGYMVSLSCVEILKYVFFFFLGLQRPNYHQEQDHWRTSRKCC